MASNWTGTRMRDLRGLPRLSRPTLCACRRDGQAQLTRWRPRPKAGAEQIPTALCIAQIGTEQMKPFFFKLVTAVIMSLVGGAVGRGQALPIRTLAGGAAPGA